MQYIPQKHKARTALRSLPFILIFAALSFAGVYFGMLFTFLPLLILLFTVFAGIVITEAAADHVYSLEHGFFRIYRKFGKYETKIFDLDLRFASEILPFSEAKKKLKKTKPAPKRISCLCGAPKKLSSALLYDPGKRTHVIYISPNETFFEALKNSISPEPVGEESPVGQ